MPGVDAPGDPLERHLEASEAGGALRPDPELARELAAQLSRGEHHPAPQLLHGEPATGGEHQSPRLGELRPGLSRARRSVRDPGPERAGYVGDTLRHVTALDEPFPELLPGAAQHLGAVESADEI